MLWDWFFIQFTLKSMFERKHFNYSDETSCFFFDSEHVCSEWFANIWTIHLDTSKIIDWLGNFQLCTLMSCCFNRINAYFNSRILCMKTFSFQYENIIWIYPKIVVICSSYSCDTRYICLLTILSEFQLNILFITTNWY